MAKLSYAELVDVISGEVTESLVSNGSLVETHNNVAGLVDKISMIFTLDSVYNIDKLNMFDGQYLSYGKIIENWWQDLILPTDFDESGSGALSPSNPTYRPVFYSYPIQRKTVKTTVRNNDLERAVHNAEQLAELVAKQFKRLEDSVAVYKYQVKMQMLGTYCSMCLKQSIYDDIGGASAITEYAISTAYSVNDLVCDDDSTPTKVAIFVKPVANTNTKTWATLVAEGTLIELDLFTDIKIPTDTSTGEAFIKRLKKDIEILSDINEGHSLNGNSLGATEGLVLIVKQGVIPDLQVETYAGTFQLDQMRLGADIVVPANFGQILDSDENDFTDKVFAILLDKRGMRLHNTYDATRANQNGAGDFENYFRHTDNTAFISRNTAVKVYADLS